MRRLKDVGNQRGAVAIVFALALVVLFGFTALAVDLGAYFSQRQQLQNGADAAALAVAESCARGNCEPALADRYAEANKLDGQASATVAYPSAQTVQVVATHTRQNWFAGVIGIPTTAISASATASWGWPSGGGSLPLTFSWCAFHQATGGWDAAGNPLLATESVIHLKERSCTPPAHNELAGGFGWLVGENCQAAVTAGNWVGSDTGADGANSCRGFDWSGIQHQSLLVPIFDQHQGSGSTGRYRIKGLAAFTTTGYCFGSQASWNVDNCPADKQIKGYFTSYIDLTGNYETNPPGPNFGAAVVKLID